MFTAFEIDKNIFSNIIVEEIISSLSYSDSCRVLQEEQKVFTPDVIVQSFFINFLEGQPVNVDPKREKMNAAFKGVFSTLKTVMRQHNEKETDPFKFAFNGKIDQSQPVDGNEYVEAFIYFLLSEEKTSKDKTNLTNLLDFFKKETENSYKSALQAFEGGKKQGGEKKQGGGTSSNINKLLINLIKKLTNLLAKKDKRGILFFIIENLKNNNLKQEENKKEILAQLVKDGVSFKEYPNVIKAIEILIAIVEGKSEEEIKKMAAKAINSPKKEKKQSPAQKQGEGEPPFRPLENPMFKKNINKSLSESKIRLSRNKVSSIISEEIEKIFKDTIQFS